MYCSGDEDKLDLVLQRQAQQLFDRGQYLESAMHFAKTRCSFESTVLKFIDLPEKTALMNYLKKKLEFTKDRMETALVVVWLVDVYLTKMSDTEQMDEDDGDGPEAIAEELEHLKADFLNLLKTPKIAECVDQNKTSLYELMSDHGHVANMIKFADVTNDYERLIKFYIQNNQFQPVLDTLREQRRPNLYYEYGSALMREKPQQLVDLFIAEGRRLNPVCIVPCLAACRSPEQEIQAMKYLEFSVNQLGSRAPATHNFLISLYIKHSPEKVDPYLKEQGFEVEQIPYDVKYTLRLCKERGLNRECVTLHCVLGQLEEAVSLALNTVDLEQAKLCLQFAEEDKEMRRKIWLKIARYVVEQKNDIKQAMEYLQECDGLVKIEDILPFFPDFVTIDHFKDAICDSLQDYSKYIAELREEMDDSNRSADKIREEIQSYKNSYHFVRATDTCSLCKTGYLMERPFHLFGCGHKFHTDCLVYEVLPLLSSGKRRKVEEIWKEINFVRHSNISNSNSSAGGSGSDDPRWQQQQQPQQDKISRSEQLKMDLDDLVAADCVACGEIVVKMIDKPFIPDASFDAVIKEWL